MAMTHRRDMKSEKKTAATSALSSLAPFLEKLKLKR
jgi:hypothetical protein